MLYFDRLAQSEARHGAVSGPLLVVPSSLLLGSPSSLANLFGENSGSGSASTDGSASPIIRIKNLDTGVSYPLLGKPLCQLPTLQKQHPPTSPNGGTNFKKQLLRRFSFSDTLQKDQHKTPARHRSNTVEADIPKRDTLLRRFSFGNSSTEKKTVNADGTQAGADQQHRDRLSMSRAVGVDDDDNDGDEWEDVEVEVEEVCKLELICKWGGDLTPVGEVQAEALGVEMRNCLYPDHGGLLRLHSTYRHDLKIYTSDEGRVQMTAAAFAKGFLELEGDLVSSLQAYKLRQLYTNTDYWHVALCTWIRTTHCARPHC
jgi:hypothetical protein